MHCNEEAKEMRCNDSSVPGKRRTCTATTAASQRIDVVGKPKLFVTKCLDVSAMPELGRSLPAPPMFQTQKKALHCAGPHAAPTHVVHRPAGNRSGGLQCLSFQPRFLADIERGDPQKAGQLFPLVYDE